MTDEVKDDVAWGPCVPETHMDWFQQRMKLSGITRGVADRAAIRLGIDDMGSHFKIPYFTVDAVPTTYVRQRNRTSRYVNEPGQSGNEYRGKYTQPARSKNRVYWPPLHTQREQFNNPSVPLIVCEGELKALRTKMACAESGINALVLGVPGTKIPENLIDELNAINCRVTINDSLVVRTVYIAVDWGGKGKGTEEGRRLEVLLRDTFQKLGARVITVRWPREEGDTSEQKIDEWLTKGGDITAALADSLSASDRQHSELQGMWDRLNSNYVIMHGFYIPINDSKEKYTPQRLKIMCSDVCLPVSKNKMIHASDIWGLQVPEEQNVVSGYIFQPAPMGHPQDRYVWEHGRRLLNTAPDWGWTSPPWELETAPSVGPFIALLERLFQEHGGWYLDFLAQIAQQPTVRGHHVIILQDNGNTGKDRLFDTLDAVFPNGYSGGVGTSFTSAFNSGLEHLLIAHWSDPVLSGRGGIDRILASILKNYSGTTFQEINHKGGAKYNVRNYGRLHIAHNQGWIVKFGEEERRYGVFGGYEVMPHEWAVEYMNWLKADGVEQIRRFLVERDISNFDIFAPAPRTTKRIEMEKASRTDLEEWLQEGYELEHKDVWSCADLVVLWEGHSKQAVTPEHVGHVVKRIRGTYKTEKQIKFMGKPLRLVALRNGEYWAERHATEGNEALTTEYKKTLIPG